MSNPKSYTLLKKKIVTRIICKSRLVVTILLGLTIIIFFLKVHFRGPDYQVPYHSLEWLRDRNYLHLFVRPNETSAIIVPKDISAYEERKFVACFVLSSPENFLRREAIRQTWGQLAKPIFLIALGDETSMKAVTREATFFDDIIVEDFIESHDNLTLKTSFALKNFVDHFPTSKYFLKIDDDMYLNVSKFHDMLDTVPINSLIGRLNPRSKPFREHTDKFYVPEFLFKPVEYPFYLEGPAYVIPGHLVKRIYETALEMPFFNMEDIFFTGIVASQTLNFKLHHDPRFRVLPFAFNLPCLYEDYIVVHEISPTNLINLWERFKTRKMCSVIENVKAKTFLEVEWSQASNQSRMLSLPLK